MRFVLRTLILAALGLGAGGVHMWVAPVDLPPRPPEPVVGAGADQPVRDPHAISLADARLRHDDPEVVFLDASRRDEYDAGHIPGAMSLPLTSFVGGAVPDELDWVDSGARVVVYCPNPRCDAAWLVAGFLRAFGFQRVEVFHDGFDAWKAAGLPVETP